MGNAIATKPVKVLPPAKGTFGDLIKRSARPGWDKGVDWAKVDRAVSRRKRSRDLRPVG